MQLFYHQSGTITIPYHTTLLVSSVALACNTCPTHFLIDSAFCTSAISLGTSKYKQSFFADRATASIFYTCALMWYHSLTLFR